MTVWCHLPTIFNQRFALRTAGLLALCVALTTTLFFNVVSHAAPGVNQTLSFQGRLLGASGSIVADGHYNMQFKIYQDGSGTTAGNPGGTLKWTESYINNGNNSGVDVKNGYFSVNLGSQNPFGNQVDWNQDTLWLSMNVAGSSNSCTSFGGSSCAADGEMLPMKRITSTPFAINSAQLGGKTAVQFLQLAQGLQEDSSNDTSIAINKTGIGNFLQFQSGSADMLTIEQDGDLLFGNGSNHTIVVDQSDDDIAGRNLSLEAGTGGNGTGSTGGALTIQGGKGGGTNGHGGWVSINAGAGTGTGNDGSILVGAYDTANINIGSSTEARTQNITIGTNDTAGSITNVTIGSGGSAAGGSTAIQSKEDTTISTNGTQRARFSENGNTLYVGNAGNDGKAETANGFTIQGTSSSGVNTQGGYLSILGGSGTNGNASGGDVYISGGESAGSGSKGLTIIDTPAFSSGATQSSASSTNIFQSDIDKYGVINLNATANNVTFTLTTPSRTTSAAGRIIYVTAANGSNNFILRANAGGGSGVEQLIPMKQNTTATMIWNGSLWTVAGSAASNSLQSSYENSVQTAGTAEIITSNTTNGSGLVVRQGSANTSDDSILTVQASNSAPLLSVNSLKDTELARNGGAETAGATASEFPANTWKNSDDFEDDPENPWDSTVTRYTTAGNNIASGNASVKVDTINNYTGARNKLNAKLTPGVSYTVNVKLRAGTSNLSDMVVALFPTGTHGEPAPWCQGGIAINTTSWTTVNCTFTAPSNVTSNNDIFITPNSETGTFYIDDFSVTRTTASSNVQIGGSDDSSNATYLTLGKSATTPTDGDNNALLGSMYYDTTLGKVQCYEADGWGACGASPDTFITLSPEYANSVTNGSGTGTMSSDICSDALNINDGSSSQPTVCDTNETYNFYKWTAADPSNSQTKSIYVTYQLPANFKNFVSGQTSLMGRTDGTNAGVSYQIYRNNSSNGLTSCGSAASISVQNDWQKSAMTGSADPANCSFEAGESVVFRINLSAKADANAYISNLNFVYSNK